MDTNPILKTEHVSVIYNEGKLNEYTALKDVSLEIFPGEYCIFYGPSGSGKSTMLYTLLGLQPPSHGIVRVQDRDSAKFTEAEKGSVTSKLFGIVFQNFNLIYSINVADNVMLPQVFADVSNVERKKRAGTLMERFGIAARAKNMPGDLSGGQQQRVAISRALINDPQILMADEPVGNLDSESARVVMQTLGEINREDKKTVILVTHDPSYLAFADRVFYFKDGALVKTEQNDHPTAIGEAPEEALDQHGKEDALKELEELGDVPQSLTLPELKAWVLTRYLMQEVNAKQLKRIEKYMGLLLDGRLKQEDFFTCLDAPFAEGGVGLYRGTAAKYSKKAREVLSTINRFKQLAAGRPNHAHRRALIHLLRRFMLSEYSGELSQLEIAHAEKAITARVHHEISADDFVRQLTLSDGEGGVHLRQGTADRLAEKLEIILASIETDYARR